MSSRSLQVLRGVALGSLLAARAAGADSPSDAGPAVSLGADDFAAVNAVDVVDLFKYAPDVFVGKRFAGDDDAVVSLRGTSGAQSARTLVMVDGFVISNFLGNSTAFAPRWNLLGPAAVEQVDILYGPYSARYGGNSLGGVVSVRTREPEAKDGYLAVQSLGTQYAQYGIDETFAGYGVEAGGGWQQASSPWSARLHARHLENVGQPATFALLAPLDGPAIVPVTGAYADPRLPAPVFGASSPVDLVDNQFDAGLGYAFRNGWKLDGLLFGRLTKQDLTDARSFLTDANGAPVFEANVGFDGAAWTAGGIPFALVRRSEYLAGIKAAGEVSGWRTSLALSHYWIDTLDTRNANFHFTFVQDGGGRVSLQDDAGWWTFDAGAERRFARHGVAFGVNANQYETRRDDYLTSNWRTAATPLFSAAAYGTTRSAGVYAEDEIRLGDAASITLGVRADRWEARDGGVARDVNGTVAAAAFPARRADAVSPKLGARAALGAGWDLQASLGAATRFPTVGELFQGRVDALTRALDPASFDARLAPEKSRDADLRVSRSFGAARITAAAFYQQVDDAIFAFDGRYRNIDVTRQVGLELIVDGSDVLLDGLDVNVSIARIDARTVRNAAAPGSEDRAFPGIPDWRTNGSVSYRLAKRVSASLGWRYGSRPESDLAGSARGDAYGFVSEYLLVDARVTWKPWDALEASLGIDNVADDAAYVYSPLAQRTGFLGVEVRF